MSSNKFIPPLNTFLSLAPIMSPMSPTSNATSPSSFSPDLSTEPGCFRERAPSVSSDNSDEAPRFLTLIPVHNGRPLESSKADAKVAVGGEEAVIV